jgi:hypothetical protein|tara:strand:+ start:124 stop:375 length:252 start_codon:yes stop_codon:yes gene_type:complete
MAITIDGKNYDETKLDDKCKTSIVQVQQLQNRLRNLQVDFDNVKILITYHSKYLTDNLPASALVEDKAKVEDKITSAEETTKV